MISSSYDMLYKATSPRFIKRWWRHTHNHRTDSSIPKQCYFITWGNLKSKLHRENPWEVHKSNFNFLVITRSMTPDDVIQPSTRLSDANPRVERIRCRIEGSKTLNTQNHKTTNPRVDVTPTSDTLNPRIHVGPRVDLFLISNNWVAGRA